MNNKPGIVIVGLGRAGVARLRDLQACNGCQLIGTLSRREMGSMTFEDALSSKAVDAIILTTENETHYELARAALQANKHVLAEFPLCLTHAQGTELFELARQHHRVLQVELIGLLTQNHAWLKNQCKTQAIAAINLEAGGDLQGWVEQAYRQGSVGHLCVGRLHVLFDLDHTARLQTIDYSETQGGFDLKVDFISQKISKLNLHYQRRKDLTRFQQVCLTTVKGDKLISPLKKETKGLFLQDFQYFLNRLHGQGMPYVSDQAVLQVLQWADAIDAAVKRFRD